LKFDEEPFLSRTIDLEEKYGGKTYQTQKAKEEKKKSSNKAAIGTVVFKFVFFVNILSKI
jgi:hypothetical protein